MEFKSHTHFSVEEISKIFRRSFSDAEGEQEGEQVASLVGELIDTSPEQDIRGFVAEYQTKLLGSIFFTRVDFNTDIEAFILSPVAILTEAQGQGLGQALINHGIAQLSKEGLELLLTYGDPSFYSKVGFQQVSSQLIKAPFPLSQPEGWLAQNLKGRALKALENKGQCVSALSKAHYW
ncbi:GNAT family N-acetyltransferase [Agaribacterium sp. ZY112]|uniref:GNAT family N-acetyltransferase n=1 Tax=Agaribacterium sp. ZY112 TaxID=3233574 RepID=UPI00352652FE